MTVCQVRHVTWYAEQSHLACTYSATSSWSSCSGCAGSSAWDASLSLRLSFLLFLGEGFSAGSPSLPCKGPPTTSHKNAPIAGFSEVAPLQLEFLVHHTTFIVVASTSGFHCRKFNRHPFTHNPLVSSLSTVEGVLSLDPFLLGPLLFHPGVKSSSTRLRTWPPNRFKVN